MNIKVMLLIITLSLLIVSTLQARSPWLGKDKAMHFLTSAYLTYWSYGISHDILGETENRSLVLSVSLTTFLGAGKELSDKHIKKTRWSWYDMAYNGAGIVFGVILIKNLR